MLAECFTNHPDELLADFQQYYGIDLWALGLDGNDTTREVVRAAILAAQLPEDSRTVRAIAGTTWSTSDYLLRNIEHAARIILWRDSDPKKRGEFPEPIPAPNETRKAETDAERAKKLARLVAEAFNM